jgi:hypothetical protein
MLIIQKEPVQVTVYWFNFIVYHFFLNVAAYVIWLIDWLVFGAVCAKNHYPYAPVQ